MSANIDTPPLYDELTQNEQNHYYLADIWLTWLSTFVDTVASYLSQNGIILPVLTTAQQAGLTNNAVPVDGQMIYNVTLQAPQVWQNGAWKTFTTT